MKVLLHPSSGQFKHLAAAFARSGYDKIYLSDTLRKKCRSSEDYVENQYGYDALNLLNLNLVERSQIRPQFRSGPTELKRPRWKPDLIISHSGWGCGLYAKKFGHHRNY